MKLTLDFVYDKINNANKFIQKSIDENDNILKQEYNTNAIIEYNSFLEYIDIRDYLLIDSKPLIPKEILLESFFNTGTLYKTNAEIYNKINIENYKKNILLRDPQIINTLEIEKIFRIAIGYFLNILRIKFEDANSTLQIISIFTQLCFVNQESSSKCLGYLQEALLYDPCDANIHYNLGFMYQKCNKIETSMIHYKLAIKLAKENEQNLIVNCYNGISCIYKSVKQWPEALHYLLKAKQIINLDPDINNSLGTVYTELRRTDLADKCYNIAIENYKNTFISTDKTFLLCELYLNYGHMFSYNGNNQKAIEQYNKSIQICPKFLLPFQNKIMNLCYLFDVLADPMYITNQHKLINNVYKQTLERIPFDFSKQPQNSKINIGIISGDFVEHPVSYFISTFLKEYNSDIFNIYCYSECIINTDVFNKNIKFKLIKGLNSIDASTLIYNDNIKILIDLTGHTAFNRLDIFYLAPAPIQITYIGYPFTTGLHTMNYRITDRICDNASISQPFYTEKLLFLDNCFLCYDVPKELPIINYVKTKNIKIGCFNRLNKITDNVIKYYNEILKNNENIEFIFKTKALINKKIQKEFLNKFDKNVLNRIKIIDCTITHQAHLLEYNKVDLAIDTFPYSGTTTTCESLLMGVPVFTVYDSKFYFHAQNVSASILKNSDLEYFVLDNKDDIHNKIKVIQENMNLIDKNMIRNKFINGNVCNKKVYMKNIENLLQSLI